MKKIFPGDLLPDELIEQYMKEAIKESQLTTNGTMDCADIPVGCIIVDKNGNIVARAHNTRRKTHSVTGHAEINAIEEFTQKNGNFMLSDSTVFVTLEPCPMCAGALAATRPSAVYYGAPNTENGACGTVFDILNRQTKVYGGIYSQKISPQLSDFFKKIRKNTD